MIPHLSPAANGGFPVPTFLLGSAGGKDFAKYGR